MLVFEPHFVNYPTATDVLPRYMEQFIENDVHENACVGWRNIYVFSTLDDSSPSSWSTKYKSNVGKS